MQIILVKLTLYVVEKCQKKKKKKKKEIQKFSVSFPSKTPLKLKYPKESNNFHLVPPASIADPCPTIIGLLFRFCNNVQREWLLCRP